MGIPGAFIEADMEGEIVNMKMEGIMVEILTNLDPKIYRKHIQTKKGKSILYVELKKAPYGTLHAALLFWSNLNSSFH